MLCIIFSDILIQFPLFAKMDQILTLKTKYF